MIVSTIFTLISDRPLVIATPRSLSSVQLHAIWVKSDVILPPQIDNARPFLDIQGNCILMIDNHSVLNCLNLESGDLMWQTQVSHYGSNAVSNEFAVFIPSPRRDKTCSVFTPQCESIEVIAYDVSSGRIKWSKIYQGIGVVTQMSADKTTIDLIGGGGHGTYDATLTIDAETGSLLRYQEQAPFISPPQPTKIVPDFLKNREDVVSNLASMDGTIYFLTEGATLWAVNETTGTVLGTANFQPEQSPLIALDPYEVAVKDGTIAVYLSDSRQLFALRLLTNR